MIGPTDFPEMSVINCHYLLRNKPEECRFSGLVSEICGSYGSDHEYFDDGGVRIIETSLHCRVQDDFDGKARRNIALET
jgi:hypothetical protein